MDWPTLFMEYQIIEEESPTDLEEAVNAAIAQHWAPIGGLAVCSAIYESGHRYFYSQALVKINPPPPNPPPQPPLGSL